jgi:cytochrome c
MASALLLALSAAPAFADGDPAAGEKVFAKCKICHQIGEGAKNMVGPVLNGVVGRKSASYPGFAYSPAYKKAGEDGMVQDEETIAKWVRGPAKFVPGNKMAFAGLTSDQEAQDVIAFLKQYDADGKKK